MTEAHHRVAARFFAVQKHYPIDRAEINRKLRALNTAKARKDSSQYHGGYHEARFELVPISQIDVPSVWKPSRADSVRERIQEGKPLDPVRLDREDGGKWGISDGIHRTNVSIELGFTHVPAIVSVWVPTPEALVREEPEKKQLDVGDWVKLKKPDEGRRYGWVVERLSFRWARDVKRWVYSIAVVDKTTTWPDHLDLLDTMFEPTKPPSWGPAVKALIEKDHMKTACGGCPKCQGGGEQASGTCACGKNATVASRVASRYIDEMIVRNVVAKARYTVYENPDTSEVSEEFYDLAEAMKYKAQKGAKIISNGVTMAKVERGKWVATPDGKKVLKP